jgi:hypothetical protein
MDPCHSHILCRMLDVDIDVFISTRDSFDERARALS